MKNHELIQEIDAALATHGSWHREMSIEMKRGRQDLSPDMLSNPTACFFGRWLDGDGVSDDVRKSDAFKIVHDLHIQCHHMMGEISGLVRADRQTDALALLNGRCEKLHRDLEEALIALRAHVMRRNIDQSRVA